MKQLKLYMMLGLPGETMADIDELGRFSMELARIAPRVVLGIAPFVAKRNTPLDGAPFEPIDVLDAKLARLRAAVGDGSCCARRRRSGPGSSTAWPRAAWRRAAPRRARRAPAGDSRTGRPRSRTCRAAAPCDDVQSPTVAIASISTRAPLGRPAA